MAASGIDVDRLWRDVMALAAITDPERPYTRRSFSPLYLEGRAWLANRFADAGLETRIDAAGNLIGRRDGSQPSRGAIALGSHSDTVPSGGRFDGIIGVLAGIEIARALRDAGVTLAHPLEIVDFLAEEPSEYGVSCIGSRGMSAALTADMLALAAPSGERLEAGLRRVGGDPGRLEAARRDDIAAFLELHIEQGAVLEAAGLSIGVVTSIVGIRRLEIVFTGAADHAGTTPFALRRDALLAAANTVVSVRRIAERLAAETAGYFVATVGILTVEPGGSNVVPGRCRLVIDMRTTDPAMTEAFVAVIERDSTAHAEAARVTRGPLVTLSDGPPVACDPTLRGILHGAAASLRLGALDLASGAGHDAAFMSRICPSAMVFVPCRAGKSHAPEEWADRDAIAAGAAVLLAAVRKLDDISA